MALLERTGKQDHVRNDKVEKLGSRVGEASPELLTSYSWVVQPAQMPEKDPTL